jgi:hypothetical protein
MASFREYWKLSVECARLARAAPSREAGDSFAAAAKSWLILDRLARASPENIAERAGRIGTSPSIALGHISNVSGSAVKGGGHA